MAIEKCHNSINYAVLANRRAPFGCPSLQPHSSCGHPLEHHGVEIPIDFSKKLSCIKKIG
jgi:hypothetical protein